MKDRHSSDSFHAHEKFLLIYQEALSSNCIDLIQMIQVVNNLFNIIFVSWNVRKFEEITRLNTEVESYELSSRMLQ